MMTTADPARRSAGSPVQRSSPGRLNSPKSLPFCTSRHPPGSGTQGDVVRDVCSGMTARALRLRPSWEKNHPWVTPRAFHPPPPTLGVPGLN